MLLARLVTELLPPAFGEYVPLAHRIRLLWDAPMIVEAKDLPRRASARCPTGRANWAEVVQLYE